MTKYILTVVFCDFNTSQQYEFSELEVAEKAEQDFIRRFRDVYTLIVEVI